MSDPDPRYATHADLRDSERTLRQEMRDTRLELKGDIEGAKDDVIRHVDTRTATTEAVMNARFDNIDTTLQDIKTDLRSVIDRQFELSGQMK